jgi:hypothetical protein
MFSALRQGSTIYVLDKGNDPSLKEASVTSYTAPQPVFGSPMSYTIDIVVSVDGQSVEFRKLPSGLDIATDPNNGLVVSTTKEAMANEVGTWVNNSEVELAKRPYHEKVVKVGQEFKKMLDPDFAKQALQAEKINNLESKMGKIEDSLSEIHSLLAKSLTTNKERK